MCDNRTFTNIILRPIVFFLMALSSGAMMAQGKVIINELMQSNVDFMMVNHDFPDSWVELYNGSDKTVDVKNYCIGPTNVFAEAAWIMTVTHKDGKSDTYTYETTDIQLDLSECMSGDTVTFTLIHATVTEIPSVNKKVNAESYFDLTGKKKTALHQGVNIVLYSDGTRKKVIVK